MFSFFLSKSLGVKKIYNLHPRVWFFHEEALSYKVSMSRFKIDPNFNIVWTCTYIGRPTDDDDDSDEKFFIVLNFLFLIITV